MGSGNSRASFLRSGGVGSIKAIFVELGRVTWPGFPQIIRLSVIVLFLSGVMAVILGLGFDQLFAWLITLIG